MTREKNRNVYVDNLKGLLIILVVVGHFTDIALDESKALESLFLIIYSFHMPLFIFLNGLMCRRIVASRAKVLDKVIVFGGLYIMLKAVLYFTRTAVGHEDINFHLFEEDGVPWYLFATAAYYVISYILRNINKKWLLALSVLLALLIGYDPDINDFLVMSRIIVFYPFFILGWMLDVHKLTQFMSKGWLRPCGIAGIAGFSILCIYEQEIMYKLRPMFTGRNGYEKLDNATDADPLFRIIAYLISFLMCFFVMAAVPHIKIWLLSTMGRRTLAIFVLHRPVLYCLTYADVLPWLRDSAGWTAGNALWLLTAVALAVILAAPVFTRAINKILDMRKAG